MTSGGISRSPEALRFKQVMHLPSFLGQFYRSLQRIALSSLVIGAACLLLFLPMATQAVMAETTADSPSSPAAASPKVSQLLLLLDDPQVQKWLHDNAVEAKATAGGPAAIGSGDADRAGTTDYLAGRLAAIHQHLRELWLAIPTLPMALGGTGRTLSQQLATHSAGEILVLLGLFVALGAGVEWVIRRLWGSIRKWLIDFKPLSESDRLLVVLVRLLYGASLVLAFAIGSTGAFLMFDWPQILRQIILSYLLAGLSFRLSLVLCRFILAPGAEKFRLLPIPTSTAWFWYRRIAGFVLWLAFGWATIVILRILGLADASRLLIAYTLGIGLLAIAVETSWHYPTTRGLDHIAVDGQRHLLPQIGRSAVAWVLTVYFFLLWLLWVAGAYPSLWTLAILFVLPLSIRQAGNAVSHLLRPAEQDETAETPSPSRSVATVCLERGLRTILIVCAAVLLAKAWHIDFVALASQDTLQTRLARGIVNAIIILLVGDFSWHVAKTIIDRKMGQSDASAAATTDEEIRQHQRLRTLLPILRNILFIVLVIIVALMALSALGVQIGPLIAGAGVVGVAVGFGAQTLVKDIISGIFYLLDDAFRIGEYIQSGNYKGTVESFSLRSVKLRHQRGPLYTVPFGVLGAIQNMSRDWVIDKLSVNVTYDTNLDNVRKLIKDIGKQLADDPEFSHRILQPLKMQGVEQFGDFAIQIRMKMMTKPGEQFVIRRKAFAMMKKAFEENGVRFATPTVQVAGNDTAAVAAHQVLAPKATRPAD